MRLVLLALLFPCVSYADVTKSEPVEKVTALEKQKGSDKVNWVKTVYTRDALSELTHIATDTNGDGTMNYHGFILKPLGSKGAVFAHLVLENGIISTLVTNSLDGYRLSIHDFTDDGRPDFIQITSKSTHKVVEAYTIMNDMVELIPDIWFREGRAEFDKDMARLIEKKSNKAEMATPRKPSD